MIKKALSFYLIILFLAALPIQVKAEKNWANIEQGLDMANFAVSGQANTTIVALRFKQSFFDFQLYSISEDKTAPKTLTQWAQQYELVAAVNASMYLPDGITSTGHMRKGSYVNNKHIAKNFGAFFLSNPIVSNIEKSRVVDRDTKEWEVLLSQYQTVIQNYRLINSKRKILWSASEQEHSIAAVAEDGSGNILFLHCREPMKAHDFAQALLQLPLDVRTVMYVEGGVQAGLALNTAENNFFWGGWHPSDIFMGAVSVALPNIIGVTRKNK